MNQKRKGREENRDYFRKNCKYFRFGKSFGARKDTNRTNRQRTRKKPDQYKKGKTAL